MMPDPLPPLRSQPARPSDSVLRLQIGAGGVLAVLLLVGLAGIITDQASDRASVDATGAPSQASSDQTASDQPLVDLGVQPANPDPAATAPVQPAIQPGTTVTDLPAAPARKNTQ